MYTLIKTAGIRPRGVSLRILTILLLSLGVGLAAATGLNYLKFERILNEAAAARYDPVLREMNRTISASLREGLTLASTRTTQDLIDRSVAQFDGAFDVVIRDADGSVLFLTEERDSQLDVAPFAVSIEPGEILHDFSSPGRFVRHMSIHQGRTNVGTLSLSHSSDAVMAEIPSMMEEMKRVTLIAIVLVLPFMIIFVVLIVGRMEGRFHERLVAIGDVERFRASDPLAKSISDIRTLAERKE